MAPAADAAPALEAGRVTVAHPKFGRTLRVWREGGAVYQNESQPGVFETKNLYWMSSTGSLPWDRRHPVVAYWRWNLPVRFSSKVADSLLGGWTLTGITTIVSGTPLTFVQGSDVALDGAGGAQHAQLAPGITTAASSNTDFAALKELCVARILEAATPWRVFNGLNQVNFSNPNQTASSAGFGRITAAASGRVIQLA